MLNNVKAAFQKLHPYAYIWIRMIMMMVFNAHVLHRLFAIEKRLHIPGSIQCLAQLRQALNYEGSLRDSLAQLARDGFTLSNVMFQGAVVRHVLAVVGDSDDDAADATHVPAFTLGDLRGTSKNVTKLAFLNTSAGTALRRQRGPHVDVTHPDFVGTCLLCKARTTHFCKMCSRSAEGIFFWVCTTDSRSASGSRRMNKSTCFEMFHNAGPIALELDREKCLSAPQAALIFAGFEQGRRTQKPPKTNPRRACEGQAQRFGTCRGCPYATELARAVGPGSSILISTVRRSVLLCSVCVAFFLGQPCLFVECE